MTKKVKILLITLVGIFLLNLLFIIFPEIFIKNPGTNNDVHPEQTFEIKVIDSCEYIYVSRRPLHNEFSLTHKGNCKYCAERAAKLHK